ncbi:MULTISPECIES: hypothetical protein [unclassified Bradyrhizobium]|uniref:hypothetical protein n=1 Tax=unclassified Bradyrhizobium TaxID=2631580 RepID=UPI0028E39468|nr:MULTISPECIES: hypothetical protein [unclassified Bradyrhizobium]
MLHDLPLPKRIDVDQIVEHSFKDYHVKGFDYLCLQRSPEETVKLYFFDGDISKLPEVVAPHNHRYDFETYVAAGLSENVWFTRSATRPEHQGQIFNWFEYRTKLNGGNGFTFAGEEELFEAKRGRFGTGESYFMHAEDLHTIRIVQNETLLVLVQFEDIVPLDKPTWTYCRGTAPSLDGLYTKFTADEVISRLRKFEERTGIAFSSIGARSAA